MFKTLSFIINPLTTKTFIEDYWEKKCLYIKRDNPNYFIDLFSLENLDNILMRGNLVYPTVQIFIKGSQVEKSKYCKNWKYGKNTYSDLIDTEAILGFFRQGATINLLGLERLFPSINRLNQGLELDSGFPVHTTCFLSPKNSENIPPHYDMVDFFVLQISGSKYWRVWQTDVGLPHAISDRQIKRTYEKGHPALMEKCLLGEFLLEPGDSLFIPRGFIHETNTTDNHSLHITIGINPHRRFDLLKQVMLETIKELSKVEYFRSSPSIQVDRGLDSFSNNNIDMLQSLKQAFVKHSKLEDTLYKASQSLDNQLTSSRYSGRHKQLSLLTKRYPLSIDSFLIRRKKMVHHFFEQNEQIIIAYLGKKLLFPLDLKNAVLFICNQDRFLVKEIPIDSNANAKITFARRLIEEGFLIPG